MIYSWLDVHHVSHLRASSVARLEAHSSNSYSYSPVRGKHQYMLWKYTLSLQQTAAYGYLLLLFIYCGNDVTLSTLPVRCLHWLGCVSMGMRSDWFGFLTPLKIGLHHSA